MKKQNNQRWQTVLLASIATIILLGASFSTFAQITTPKEGLKPFQISQNYSFGKSCSIFGLTNFQYKNLLNETAIADDFPKPDFKEMEQWFEIQKYEYKILNQRLNIVVKAKADREDRPHYFNIDFYDADGVRVISTNYITEEYVAETGQIEKIWAFTPSESQMKKVKSVVITRVVN